MEASLETPTRKTTFSADFSGIPDWKLVAAAGWNVVMIIVMLSAFVAVSAQSIINMYKYVLFILAH